MRFRYQYILVTLMFVLSTVVISCAGPRYTILELSSGKEIKSITIFVSKDTPILWWTYQTDLNINDKEKLRKEVEEIFSDTKDFAARTKRKEVIIEAREVSSTRGYVFVFQKSENGEWRLVDEKINYPK